MKPISEFTVAELMQPNVIYVKEATSLTDALHLMDTHKVSSLIVERSHPLDAFGILTRKDIVIELAENWDGLANLKVSDLATKPVIGINPTIGIKHAVRLMRLSGVRRLAVMNGDQLVGIIGNGDVFRAILKSVKK